MHKTKDLEESMRNNRDFTLSPETLKKKKTNIGNNDFKTLAIRQQKTAVSEMETNESQDCPSSLH